ncbi:MAG TPA: MFS transporter [Xanthobacteraceae bacterium]|nr:MFS transporter [Xanthobacteraceae bacterium]
MSRIFKVLMSPFTTFRAAPSAARVGSFLFFVASVADGTLMPFFPLWARNDAGIPVQYIGLLLGCYAGGELLATPFVGGIADRVGRRPVLLASTTGIGVGFLLLFFAPGVIATAGALLVIGLFESVLHPTAATVITDVVPAEERRNHFAMTRMMSNAGRIVGPALGGVLALWSLHLVFFGAAAAILTGAAVVAALLPETWHGGSEGEEDDDDESLTALGAALRDRRLAGLLLSISALEIAVSWIEAVTPLYATAAGAVTPTGVGLLFAYAGVVGVIFQLPVSQASQRVSGFATVLAAGAIEALGFVFLLPAPALPLLIAAITCMSFARMLSGPLVQAIVSELAPRNAQATYQAAFSVVFDLKDAAGPALGTWLYAISAVLPWGTGIAVSLIASGALAVAARRHETDQTQKS